MIVDTIEKEGGSGEEDIDQSEESADEEGVEESKEDDEEAEVLYSYAVK